MRKTMESTGSDWFSEPDRRDEDEITVPVVTICSQAGTPRNARTHWLKKKGESAPRRTLDWKDIGEPSF